MHSSYTRADELSKQVIGAAIEVHRIKGAGLIESIYEKCLMRELQLRGIDAKSQVGIPIEYKGYIFDETLRLDILVDNCLLLELKSVEKVHPIHKAQLLSYMKLLQTPIGLLFNFHELQLRDGIHRMILPGANL
ncbi:GxxExxY protein [Desulfoferrobacter suflitae]|uniref:GxxExxY protein n=1 Tax=Desulfoferrobacter suflitae TaxID=2865782 RepID=UPI002164EC21|nr:GxxExxY protein [Desulfoferrobacter suflitae]MCK8604369.1 GxxExxY protein [Desulfoferrobacter suflitae]